MLMSLNLSVHYQLFCENGIIEPVNASVKASANKISILKSLIKTPKLLMYLGHESSS